MKQLEVMTVIGFLNEFTLFLDCVFLAVDHKVTCRSLESSASYFTES